MKKVIEILKMEIPLPKVSERHKIISGWITAIIAAVMMAILMFQIYMLFDIHLSILPKIGALEHKCNLQEGVAEEIKVIKFHLFLLLVGEFFLVSFLYDFVSGIRKSKKELHSSEE